jgi:hypothetical protein
MSFYIGSNKITPALLNQKSSGGIENTATGTDSLTILGTPATSDWSTNIGVNSEANGGRYVGSTAIGYNTVSGEGAVAIGAYNDDSEQGATAEYGCVAIGMEATAFNNQGDYNHNQSIAIGKGASAKAKSVVIGGYSDNPENTLIGVGTSASSGGNLALGCEATIENAYGGSIAIGPRAYVSGYGSIALGPDVQSTSDCEFVVGGRDSLGSGSPVSYKMLDFATGKIPNDRINGATGSFTSADGKTITVTNGVITSIV